MIVNFDHVSKIYYKPRTQIRDVLAFKPRKSFKVLNDLSFSIEKGERIAFIGLNGAGKSTILKIISRITYPTEGSVMINGTVATLLEVGAGFHGELTGYQNVFMNGTILGLSKKEIKKYMRDIIDFSEIAPSYMELPLSTYSSGMKSRLGFSIARLVETDILILDETLSVGDASFRQKAAEAMQKMFSQGRTVLFVTHSIQSVLSMATRVIWIEKGNLIGVGEPKDIIQQYLDFHNIVVKK